MGNLIGRPIPEPEIKTKEVDGMTYDLRADGTMRVRPKKLVLRVTEYEYGRRTLSLCDELRGIMMEIPLEEALDWLLTREPEESAK